ncbi:hypothetical protein N7452_001089 [Penicillium brevicompactum]|uniref:Uncharacterized protein n=1 Tax=Penicillium brevicompactum TaxID=5074 RepID=A0A9W9R1X1_PENBR|nr:hypothetical protein N7452_001089 [Penicillium brevicompactum]
MQVSFIKCDPKGRTRDPIRKIGPNEMVKRFNTLDAAKEQLKLILDLFDYPRRPLGTFNIGAQTPNLQGFIDSAQIR